MRYQASHQTARIRRSVWKALLLFFLLGFTVTILMPGSVFAQADNGETAGQHNERFAFPTSKKDASFSFTSVPDLFNWNIRYPQPGWEEAMDWFLDGMKKEGPALL